MIRTHDLPDETIAAAMRSLDKLRRLGIVVERFSHLLNSDFENRVADKSFRPKRAQQFVLGHHLTGTINEVVKQGKRFRTDLQRLLILPKTFVNQIERNAI